MSTIWIKEFTGGLDTRRLPEAAPPGILVVANNGHITRGGDFEQRAAFVLTYPLPIGTVGLFATTAGLVTFGSGPEPSEMPSAVEYQRLQHSDGLTDLVRLLSTDLYRGKVYAVGEFADGAIFHFYDGVRVQDWYDGRARATFAITAGDATAKMTDIKVNGVSIMSAPVSWATSNESTAAAIAAAINSHTSSPDYTAAANGAAVSIAAVTPGSTPNGYAVSFTLTTPMAVTPLSPSMANGADSDGTYQPGEFVRTIGQKMYSTSGSTMHFSGIQDPESWTTDVVGAGFIDMASESSGFEKLVALARYQAYVTVFAERAIQIWYTDPDPNNNKQYQLLANTGTGSPRSVTAFGDADVFYLDESGLRSLKARDSSNAAATTDIGVPVDDLITAKLKTLTENEREQVVGLIEPGSGRFWLIMRDRVFVFSFFNGAKVSAWSTYDTTYLDEAGQTVTFNVDYAVVAQRRVFLRSGNYIFAYGGVVTGDEHDATVAEAWLPYLDANKPELLKMFTGVDAALSGEWAVSAAMNLADINVEDEVAVMTETTYNIGGSIPFNHAATHVSLRFRSRGVGPHRLASCVIHFAKSADED